MEMLGIRDVCFYTLVSGRNKDSMELAGMVMVRIPLRLRCEDTLAGCQAQLLSSTALADRWAISEAGKAFLGGGNRGNLNIWQELFDYGSECRALTKEELSDVMKLDPDQVLPDIYLHDEWCMVVEVNEQLRCRCAYNANVYDPDFMKKIPSAFLRQLKAIVKEDM